MAARVFGAPAHEHRRAVFCTRVWSGVGGRPAGESAAEIERLPSAPLCCLPF